MTGLALLNKSGRKFRLSLAIAVASFLWTITLQTRAVPEDDVFQQAVNYVFTVHHSVFCSVPATTECRLSGREGTRGKIGVARIECSNTQRQKHCEEGGTTQTTACCISWVNSISVEKDDEF
jgi:hypothetical protein